MATFQQALEWMRKGKKVYREVWREDNNYNSTPKYIYLGKHHIHTDKKTEWKNGSMNTFISNDWQLFEEGKSQNNGGCRFTEQDIKDIQDGTFDEKLKSRLKELIERKEKVKLKVGDKVRVIDVGSYYFFEVGKIEAIIEVIDENKEVKVVFTNKDDWGYFKISDLELVKEKDIVDNVKNMKNIKDIKGISREEFNKFTEEMWKRLKMGERKYGVTYQTANIFNAVDEEFVDVANYSFMLYLKLEDKRNEKSRS